MRTLREHLRGLWEALGTVPYLPVAGWVSFIGWTALPSGGLYASPNHILPHWLVISWTLAYALGGTLSVLGGLTRQSRVESSGLALILMGLVFDGSLAVLKGDPSTRLGTAVAVVAFIAMCLIRMRVLSLARKAQKKAARLLDGGE